MQLKYLILSNFDVYNTIPADDTTNECVICYNTLLGQEVILMNCCSLKVHKSCIDEWLKNHDLCPHCRRNAVVTINLCSNACSNTCLTCCSNTCLTCCSDANREKCVYIITLIAQFAQIYAVSFMIVFVINNNIYAAFIPAVCVYYGSYVVSCISYNCTPEIDRRNMDQLTWTIRLILWNCRVSVLLYHVYLCYLVSIMNRTDYYKYQPNSQTQTQPYSKFVTLVVSVGLLVPFAICFITLIYILHILQTKIIKLFIIRQAQYVTIV